MSVKTVNNEQLRHLIYSCEFASVKYTAPECSVCADLAPSYEALSERSQYKPILFLRIDSGENPIARKFLAESATPLMVSYHNGVVTKAATAYTVEDIVAMLDELLRTSAV